MEKKNQNQNENKTKQAPSCCSGGSGCCGEMVKQELHIEFLYLDLTQCERCQGTESNLEEALRDVSAVLHGAGYEVKLDKINVDTRELAVRHRFVSSPTIRVNGHDIAMDVRESNCTDCGDLCGDSVDCRVFVHEGVEYSEPPKAMIINAILKGVYREPVKEAAGQDYVLPDNLEKYYTSLERKRSS